MITHLHVHSHFSLFRATPSPSELVQRAEQEGLASLALTDRGGLFGAVQFVRACEESGILPILGLTLSMLAPGDPASGGLPAGSEAVLLAIDASGFRSLSRLSSILMRRRWQEGAHEVPLGWHDLQESRQGLFFIDAGIQGRLSSLVAAGELAGASAYLSRLAGFFGDECAIGLGMVERADPSSMRETISIAGRFGVPILPLQPVYTLDHADCELLPSLFAIGENLRIDQVPAHLVECRAEGSPRHWVSQEVLGRAYSAYPGMVSDLDVVLRRFQPSLQREDKVWPVLGLAEGSSPERTLREEAKTGLARLFPDGIDLKLEQRFEHELAAINGRNYAPLFLLVSDITAFAREKGIPINTRGSVANSLIAYAIGITDVDPVANDLLFERFLNPARRDLPDIDLDFCSRRRDEVLDYLRESYGTQNVAQVATVNTLRIRSAVRETAKAHGFAEPEIRRLTRGLPRFWHPDPGRRGAGEWRDALARTTVAEERAVLEIAFRLIGQPDHISVHPGGAVITPFPVQERLPVLLSPVGHQVTQFDHKDLSYLGIPKVDLLGVRALTVKAEAVRLVREHHPSQLDALGENEGDGATEGLLTRGETIGVFQCESEGARRTLRQLRAKNLQDLAVANAFFKPGPATGGMAESFIRRYRGEEEVEYLHPALAPILKSTKGVLIFQEQVLRVATEIAGLSWAEADLIRRGMSQFRREEMRSIQARFIEGCLRSTADREGMTQEQAGTLWEQVRAFSGYGFNKGHATAYAKLSYELASIKAHWPACLLAARLAYGGGFYHPAVYAHEAKRWGVQVRPPHVNRSLRRFRLEFEEGSAGEKNPVIWMGLGNVRDLTQKSIQAIISERNLDGFSDFRDFIARLRLRDQEMQNLIRCGALDGLIESRSQALDEYRVLSSSGSVLQHSFDFFDKPEPVEDRIQDHFWWEHELLGMPVSVNPMDLVTGSGADIVPLEKVAEQDAREVTIRGYRLPSWSRRGSLLVSDGAYLLDARVSSGNRRGGLLGAWHPAWFTGRWMSDGWDGGWFQVRSFEEIPLPKKSTR